MLGEIHDATGAVLSGASITAVNRDTGVSFSTTSGDAGQYEIPSLRTGIYKITAAHDGFSSAVADNITVSVGVRQRINLTLQVGKASAITVEVSDVALQLETESSERGETVTGYQTEAFPLVGRNYADLLGLVVGARQAPTAATTSAVSSLVRQGAYNVNGQRSMFNNFLLDGMDNNAYGESNQGFDNQIVNIPPDSVAQWNVVTNNESAEFGRSSGATVNVASASGTNQFHTTLYEFVRNTDLNAAGFFKPTLIGSAGAAVPFVKPVLHRNQYGLNFGGPILKDRLFYFVDYEGLRATLSPLYTITLPTQNELNGILVAPVVNPQTGTMYAAGSKIPTTAMNSLSASVLTYFKNFSSQLPSAGLATTGLASNDYAKEVPFTDKFDKGDLRLDYHQNATNSWFARISDRKETGVNNPTIPLPLDGQTNGTIRVLDQQVALGYTHLIGENKVIDARLGLSRTKAGKWSLSIGDNAFNIPGLPTTAGIAGGLPAMNFASGSFTGFGRQTTNPQWQNPALIDPKVNFTWLRGKHSLKFGYEYEHVWMAVNDNNPLYGGYSFSGGYSLCTPAMSSSYCATLSNGTAAPKTAVADTYWADFLFGLSNSYQLANYFVAHLRQSLDSAYAQDDWKVTPNLTLNLGLRWEYGSPYSEQHNNISNFDPVSQTVLTIAPGATTGSGITAVSPSGTYGKTLVNPDYGDWSPRIGFAYAVSQKTVVRGGFGTGYVHYTRAGSGDILAINAPQAQFAAVTQITPTTSNGCSTPLPSQIIATGSTTPKCFATISQGFPSGLTTSFNSATDNITWINKNKRDSYVENAFLSVQQQLAKNTILDVAYIFNHGVKLEGFVNGNQKNPSNSFARPYGNWPSDITEALNEFYSNFNALQVKYEQRFVGGLTLLNSFTWEHSLDNASASLEGNTPSPQDGNNIRADYGQSDYNLPVANVTSLVYELPIGHGHRYLSGSSKLVNTLVGGWQVSAINTIQAGTPFNITYSPNSAQAVSPQISATYRGANEYRPYAVPGKKVTQGRGSRAANTGYVNYINYNAFVLQPIKDAASNVLSPFGTAPRNPGRTPGYYNLDFDMVKKFNTPIERAKIEFRAEAYNLTNHTNLYLPSTIGGTQGTTTSTLGAGASATLGEITGGTPTSGGQITSTFQPRVLQFGLKVIY
ncbi:TonB-dependent receptor domain-containing protein [Telmatobacter bradus]|uniref:TonB-dependent receptor domain-containing protein n=1 Tax=Telmatobacter bradus TaxID=474953 RepID=UPI003B42A47A